MADGVTADSRPDHAAPGTVVPGDTIRRARPERDYIERTIATVRIHITADNCWPQWANVFADEIEACWAEITILREEVELFDERAQRAQQYREALERIAGEVEPPNAAILLDNRAAFHARNEYAARERSRIARAALAAAGEPSQGDA